MTICEVGIILLEDLVTFKTVIDRRQEAHTGESTMDN